MDTFQIYNNQRLSIQPVAFADWFITAYNLNCLTDSSNPPQWCQVLDQSNSSTVPNNPCDICRLKALKTQMSDGRLYDPGLASMYSTLTASCSATSLGAIVTPTPDFASVTAGSNSTTSTTTSTCTGSMVSIPTGQSCVDFARNNNISTDHLMDINSLSGNCANWPGNRTSLCVEDDCVPYVVGQNDTCPSVANANNITITQLLSWNPYIDPLCKNFNQKIGKVICLSSPFGYTPPPSNSFGNGPAPATTAAPVPSTADSESNKDCGNWYLVQPGDYCSLLCTKNGISLSDFLFLNPDINGNCTNLLAGESYCVEAVGDISTYPGYGGSSSPATTTTSSLNFSTLSTYTMPTFNSTPTTTGFPLANGSISGCYSMLNNNQARSNLLPCFDEEYGSQELYIRDDNMARY